MAEPSLSLIRSGIPIVEGALPNIGLSVWRPTPYCACSHFQARDVDGVIRTLDWPQAMALHIALYKHPEFRRRKIREKEALTPSVRAEVRSYLNAMGVSFSEADIVEARAEKRIPLRDPIPEGWENAGTEAIALDPRENPQLKPSICPAHQGLDTDARYLASRNEFVREQTARQILINVVGPGFVDEDYSFTMLPETVPSVPGARKVRVDYKGLNQSQRNQIKALADLQFGVGQVEV